MVYAGVHQEPVFSVEVEGEFRKRCRPLLRCWAKEMALCLLVLATVVEILVWIRSGTKVERAKRDPVVEGQTVKRYISINGFNRYPSVIALLFTT